MNRIRISALGGGAFLLMVGGALAATATDAAPGMTSKASASVVAPVTVTPLQVARADSAPVMAPMALNSLSNPPDQIATARVVDNTGATVGAVQKVDIQGGKPSDVKIALLGTQQIVALDASQVSYDASNNVLTAALDKSQIVQLPAEPQS